MTGGVPVWVRDGWEEPDTAVRADAMADEAMVAQEIARFVGRSDITEEVVRFRGHLEHWQALTRSRNRGIAQRARKLEQSTGRLVSAQGEPEKTLPRVRRLREEGFEFLFPDVRSALQDLYNS